MNRWSAGICQLPQFGRSARSAPRTRKRRGHCPVPGWTYSEERTELVDGEAGVTDERRRVPRLTSAWRGTERVTSRPAFIMIRWLPVCRTATKPALANALAAPAPDTTGRRDIGQTVTSRMVAPADRVARSFRASMQPRIASSMFSSASSTVSPCEWQPGSAGQADDVSAVFGVLLDHDFQVHGSGTATCIARVARRSGCGTVQGTSGYLSRGDVRAFSSRRRRNAAVMSGVRSGRPSGHAHNANRSRRKGGVQAETSRTTCREPSTSPATTTTWSLPAAHRRARNSSTVIPLSRMIAIRVPRAIG